MIWEIVACFFGFMAGWCGRYGYWCWMDKRHQKQLAKKTQQEITGSDEDFAASFEKLADHEHKMMLVNLKSNNPGAAEIARDSAQRLREKAQEYRRKCLNNGAYR